MVMLRVDDTEIQAEAGANLLQTCLANGIFVPNLCHLEQMAQGPASCRLCFVSIDGVPNPVTACTVLVQEGMVVRTDTPEVRRLQKAGFRLLLSVHEVDCKHCPANKKCALQDIARFLRVGLKPGRLEKSLKPIAIVDEHPCLNYFPNKCVLCGKCVAVCREMHDIPMLAIARRGFDTVISAFGVAEDAASACASCLACADICPVGALIPKDAGADAADRQSVPE